MIKVSSQLVVSKGRPKKNFLLSIIQFTIVLETAQQSLGCIYRTYELYISFLPTIHDNI